MPTLPINQLSLLVLISNFAYGLVAQIILPINQHSSKHPCVIYTYDVTHAMALLLKHELATSEKYQSFIQKCNQCRHQLQLTELSFISPPSQLKINGINQ